MMIITIPILTASNFPKNNEKLSKHLGSSEEMIPSKNIHLDRFILHQNSKVCQMITATNCSLCR